MAEDARSNGVAPPPVAAPGRRPQITVMPDETPPPEKGKPRTAPPLTVLKRPKRDFADPAVEEDGPKGPEPTRYNDWEQKGRATDF